MDVDALKNAITRRQSYIDQQLRCVTQPCRMSHLCGRLPWSPMLAADRYCSRQRLGGTPAAGHHVAGQGSPRIALHAGTKHYLRFGSVKLRLGAGQPQRTPHMCIANVSEGFARCSRPSLPAKHTPRGSKPHGADLPDGLTQYVRLAAAVPRHRP